MTSRGSFRVQFALHRASEILARGKDIATALTIAGSRFAPLTAAGVAMHALLIGIGACTRSFDELAKAWRVVEMSQSLSSLADEALRLTRVRSQGEWHLCLVDGQGLLMRGSDQIGLFAERDPRAIVRYIREALWKSRGGSARLAPAGRWGDRLEMLSAPAPQLSTSEAAEAIWRRLSAFAAAGTTRTVLLYGPPGTGKSTIAAGLARRAIDGWGGRVLRIAVSDFHYLRPSHLQEALLFLAPDIVLVDDLDRFAANSDLLDVLEQIHGRQRLLVATANSVAALDPAVMRPGRFDERFLIGGVGRSLAAQILGGQMPLLAEAQLATIGTWPAAYVAELAVRLRHLGAMHVDAEVAELAQRLAGAATKKSGEGPGQTAPSEENRTSAARPR